MKRESIKTDDTTTKFDSISEEIIAETEQLKKLLAEMRDIINAELAAAESLDPPGNMWAIPLLANQIRKAQLRLTKLHKQRLELLEKLKLALDKYGSPYYNKSHIRRGAIETPRHERGK